VISRYFVIVLALVATAIRVNDRAWLEASGLAALAAGLVVVQLASTRPALKPLAWAAFSVTAVVMVIVAVRMRTG